MPLGKTYRIDQTQLKSHPPGSYDCHVRCPSNRRSFDSAFDPAESSFRMIVYSIASVGGERTKMMPVAGNIQTSRKNCFSQNYPFRKDEDEPDEEECEIPPTEYEDNYLYRRYDNKPSKYLPFMFWLSVEGEGNFGFPFLELRRDFLREQFRKKATQTVMKQAQEQYETIHSQEVERMPLKKRPDYYMAKDINNEPQYNLNKTDDMMTFWSYRSRTNASRRRNTNFTKPISEQLDQQFG